MKAGKLAEILLQNPNAEVYVQMDDNENGCLVTSLRPRVDNYAAKPQHIFLLYGDSVATVFIPELSDRIEKVKKEPPPVLSKSGKILG